MLHSKVKIIDKGVFNTVPCLKTPPYNFTFFAPHERLKGCPNGVSLRLPLDTL